MGWLLRTFGGVVGFLVGVGYTLVAALLLGRLAVWAASALTDTDPQIAAARITAFSSRFLGYFLAGYLLTIVVSYLLTAALGLATPVAPGWGGPAVYLLVAGTIMAITIVRAADLVLDFSAEALVVLVALAAFAFGHTVIVAASYAAASALSPGPAPPLETPGESIFRGGLVGVNTAANLLLGVVAYRILLHPVLGRRAFAAAVVIAIILAAINAAAVLASAALTLGPGTPAAILQGLVEGGLGWLSWLMPMSWIVTAPGAIFFYLSWLGHCLSFAAPATFAPVPFRVEGIGMAWPTGMMLMDSGIVGNTSGATGVGNAPLLNAFNMGCFVFTTRGNAPAAPGAALPAATAELHAHEAGHGLSLAAFGGGFHYVGAVDETPALSGFPAAYAERIAQSNFGAPGTFFGGVGIVPVWM